MNSTELWVLETLAKAPKSAMSISDIARAPKGARGRAYYKNVHAAVRALEAEGIVRTRKAGKTSLVEIGFGGPLTAGALGMMEIGKKLAFLKEEPGEGGLVRDLEGLEIAALIRPRENLALNICEVLCVSEGPDGALDGLRRIGKMRNRRIIPLALTPAEFTGLLGSGGGSAAREALRDCIVLAGQEAFWRLVESSQFAEDGREGLQKSLARFGYEGWGAERAKCSKGHAGGGQIGGLEEAIIACILSGDARLFEAVPALLAKNRANYRLLLYLALKGGVAEKAGFLAATAAATTGRDDLKRGAKVFEPYKKGPTPGKNPLAREWGVRTRDTAADFKRVMEVYGA